MADANNHITYSLADIQRYLKGSMSAKEMHELERTALEDPFLADALEGYREADMQQAQQHLAQIETAIRQQKEEGKVVVLPPLKKFRSWQVAASIILLIGIVGVTYFIFNKKGNEVAFAKVESSRSATPATDTVQMRVETASPPAMDSTTIAKREGIGDEKGTGLLADNKRKNKKEFQEPTAEAPVPMAAMKKGSSKEGRSAKSAMAIQDSFNETARTMTDNHQQTVEQEMKPSTADEAAVTGYGTLRKDSDKARLSARIARAGQLPKNEIAGTIIDNHQQPVPNAKVILQDSTQAVTDRNGNFSIPTNDSSAVASITAFGYKPVDNQKLRKGRNSVTLKEKPFLLSDVEVTNLVTKGKQIADTADVKPQGGWQSFQEYVYHKLNKKYDSTALSNNAYINGDLELEFSISKEGNPYDFKILHAPDTQTANDAITAIKEGPRWINSDKSIKMRVTVRYK